MSDDLNLTIIKYIFSLLSFLINLGFLIAGSIILNDTSDLSSDSEFSNIWICNLILTILSGFGAIIALKLFCKTDNQDNSLDILIQLGSVGVSIWAIILYYEKTDLNSLQNESNELYLLLVIRVYCTLIGFGLGFFGLLIGIFLCCFHLWKDEEDQEINIRNTRKENNDLTSIRSFNTVSV